MKQLRALDLYCCAGGASMGLALAGFEVVGVDIDHQPNYTEYCQFVQGDALSIPLEGFDFIWASPPCQAYSPLNAYNKKTYPDLIAMTRLRLHAAGVPYVIENVVQAPLENPVMLCGAMFGLKVYRHRNFEASFPIKGPTHPRHFHKCSRNGNLPIGNQFMTITGGKHSIAWRKRAAEAMEVGWMREIREVCEAIPPRYAEYIGRAAIKNIQLTANQ